MEKNERLLWAVSYYHLCNDGTLMAIVALLPILVNKMGISYYDVGLLGLGLIVTLVVQYGVGKVADRRPSRILLEVGAILLISSLLLLFTVNDFLGLFLVMMLMRVGAAFYHPVGSCWITRAFQGPGLDRALGIQSGIGNLGMIIAWGTSGFLGESFGWRVPCLLWAIMNLAAIAIGFMFLKESNGTPVGPQRTRIPSRSTLLRIGTLSIPIIAGEALYEITSYFGPLNLTENGDWSPGGAGLMFAFWTAVGTVTAYFFGRFSARFGRDMVLLAGFGASGIAVLLLGVTESWYALALILAVYGAMLYLTFPALISLVSDATHQNERGTAFGILYGLQLAGGAAVIPVCGSLAEYLGDPAYAFIVAFVLAAASVVVILMRRRTRQE